MTAAKYLPALESLPEIAGEIYCEAAQLIGADIGGCEVTAGDQTARYGPVAQLVSPGRPVSLMLLHQRGPGNDNTPAWRISPSMTMPNVAAMPSLMRELLTARGMPFWLRRMAEDWLRRRFEPGAMQRGSQILRQAAQVMAPNAGTRRAGLKIMHSSAAPIALQPAIFKSSRSLEKHRERKRAQLLLASPRAAA